MPRADARGANTSRTWFASSRVGTRINARGANCSRCVPLACKRASNGNVNASVLPEPVRPRPRVSRPARASAIVACWIGKGARMPCSARTSTRGEGRPRSAKEGLVSMGVSPYVKGHRYRCVPMDAPEVLNQTTGCPVEKIGQSQYFLTYSASITLIAVSPVPSSLPRIRFSTLFRVIRVYVTRYFFFTIEATRAASSPVRMTPAPV